jgi:pimeloyl-ACP methyl ester carboxylesterase
MKRRQILLLAAVSTALAAVGRGRTKAQTAPPDAAELLASAPFDSQSFNRLFQHDYAEVNEIRLHYVSGGQGTPLVLLHGYPQTWYGWRKVMPRLAQNYRLIVPDLRGLGESSRPVDGDYTKKAVAADIHQLMQQLGLDRFAVAGQDMGGPVAYALAALYPESVTKLIAIDTGIPNFGLEEAMNPAAGGSWHFGFFAVPQFPELLTRGREVEFLTQFAFRSHYVYQQAAITDADIAEYLRSYSTADGMSAGFGYYRAFAQDRLDNQAQPKLKLSVLAVGGRKGLGEFTAQDMRNAAENVASVIIEDCGHFVYDEQPEALANTMLSFLND